MAPGYDPEAAGDDATFACRRPVIDLIRYKAKAQIVVRQSAMNAESEQHWVQGGDSFPWR
jgi:hypothetical protein